MVKAQRVVHSLGGAQRANFGVRLWLALAGAVPWDFLPAIPGELFLLPRSTWVSPSRFAPWARGIKTPRTIQTVVSNESTTAAAAYIAGVDRIFTLGGAQAVAALAYGTQTIPAVDKIVGPGNIYVATAKKQVFGPVDIDSVAGPSEIVGKDPRLAWQPNPWALSA